MLCPILLFPHNTPYGDLVSPSLVLSLLLSLYSDYLPPPCTLHLWPCGAMSLEPVILILYTHMAAAGSEIFTFRKLSKCSIHYSDGTCSSDKSANVK